jgi:predicted cupin superfamily sugar epimerase
MAAAMTAADVVASLNLRPHPEGGWFAETFRDVSGHGGRGHSTAIYYLLAAGQKSHWHRVDAVEVWHFYAGAPLRLRQSTDGKGVIGHDLGPDLMAGERPQVVVPARCWQSATSMGAWTLVGCTVAPAFDFANFELAPADWEPA